jgi:prepilin-type N-terminal cleavage/methylation domain-containing protein
MSTHTGSRKSAPRGFTLVELLVVIAIIGTLVGLLLPAVQAVREKGRQTVCTNNQHEVSTAILSYESANSHFPGCLNSLVSSSGTNTVNWAIVLLPYLGRNDLWLGTSAGSAVPNGWCTGSTAAVGSGTATCVGQFLCPDDLGWGSGANCAPLSYVVNGTRISNGTIVTSGTLGLDAFDNRAGVYDGSKDCTMSQIRAPGQTIMLGEKNSGTNASSTSNEGCWWSFAPGQGGSPTTSAGATPPNLTFVWPNKNGVPNAVGAAAGIFFGYYNQSTGVPNTTNRNHTGLVIVSFFDGHTALLPDSANVANAQFLPGP